MDSWRRPEVPVLPGRGPEPRLRDTATGELTVAAAAATATVYACGITPYDATHIGHAATFAAWDLLVRAWRDAGHDVIYVQNVTDVDDPLLERAERDGEDWRDLAIRETERYRRDMEALRVLPPDRLVGAVEALPVIERFNERLAARGALYDLDGDIYFARGADPSFGALSGPGTASDLNPEQMTALAAERGGDPDRPGKKDRLDATVWRAERPGEPAWGSRFGPGRPGWHVECAAIATEYLGPSFDVQAGGSDLVFPHHEMSASHTRVALCPPEAAECHAFARLYAHAGMVSYHGAKMSKSLGNLVFVSSLLQAGVDPMAIRLALLAHHYRSDWEWTDSVLAEAQARLARWRAALAATAPGISAASGVSASAAPRAPYAARAAAAKGAAARAAAARAAGASPPSPGTFASGAAISPGVPAAPSVPASPGVPSAPGTSATPRGSVIPGEAVLAAVRERLADDLDAPGALAVIDRWADAVLATPPASPPGDPGPLPPADPGPRPPAGRIAAHSLLVRDAADALLGVAL